MSTTTTAHTEPLIEDSLLNPPPPPIQNQKPKIKNPRSFHAFTDALRHSSTKLDDMLEELDLSQDETESLLASHKYASHRKLRTALLSQQLTIAAQDHAQHAILRLVELSHSNHAAIARLAATQLLAYANLTPPPPTQNAQGLHPLVAPPPAPSASAPSRDTTPTLTPPSPPFIIYNSSFSIPSPPPSPQNPKPKLKNSLPTLALFLAILLSSVASPALPPRPYPLSASASIIPSSLTQAPRMLRFRVFKEGSVPADLDLSTAYLVGSDSVPIRGEFSYSHGEIICRKRAAGPAALTMLWEMKNFGSIMLETTRLPERDEPYILSLEFARGRVMRLMQKREEWGLFDVVEAAPVNEKALEARDLLLEAITHQEEPAVASAFADKCLAMVLPISEQAALTHADLLLQRRISTRNFPRGAFGVRIDSGISTEAYRRLMLPNADFVRLPMWWKNIEPQEQAFSWGATDEWIEFLRRARVPVVAGPLVHFAEPAIPEWLYIWEHDYETVRDLLYEHIDRVVQRYPTQVALWNVLSGLHVNAQFSFTFDQLMDLTRMTVGLVKKVNPKARTMIELTQPWGEYYATNQRSIPPLLYAEMIVQSGIQFDVFGVQLKFGIPRDGCWQRDLFQISCLLDRFAALGKPVMISGLQVPSAPVENAAAGTWRKPWTEVLQAKWMEAVTDIALSKPYVEAICWHDLTDPSPKGFSTPHGGLANADLSAKQSLKTWSSLRRAVLSFRQPPTPPPPPPPLSGDDPTPFPEAAPK